MKIRHIISTIIVSAFLLMGIAETRADEKTSAGTTLLFIVCHMTKDQGELDINGFPKDGYKLKMDTCRKEYVQMYNQNDPMNEKEPVPDFSSPWVCARMGMLEVPHWQELNPRWLVLKVFCPYPNGAFPALTEFDTPTTASATD